jgi:hypothetical protein
MADHGPGSGPQPHPIITGNNTPDHCLRPPDRVRQTGPWALPVEDWPCWREAEARRQLGPADVHLHEARQRVRVVPNVRWCELLGSNLRTAALSELRVRSTIRLLTSVVLLRPAAEEPEVCADVL